MTGPSRSASHSATGRSILIAWALLSAILLASGWNRIAAGQLPDPDDALRLVQLRDLIAGQGWFDTVQHRIDPPGGTPMHWSRLVDIPLLLVALVAGETAALVIVPLLTLGVIVWAVGQLAARSLGPDKVIYACLVSGFLPPLVMQIQPMRIDHHGWQVAMVALAALALTSRYSRRGGIMAGLAMAAGLSISVELLPLSAVFAAVLAWRWWRDPALAGWLAGYLQALALGLAGLFALTRGIGALTPWCDAISPPYLLFFIVVAAGATVAERLRLSGVPALTVVAIGGATGLAVIGWSAPQCLALPFAGLDPLVREYWYIHIAEGQPLWRQSAGQLFVALVPLVAALGACGMLWLRSAPRARMVWAEHAVLVGGAIGLGLVVSRSLGFAAVLAAVPLGWLLAVLLEQARSAAGSSGKLAAVVAIVVLLAPNLPLLIVEKLAPPAQTSAPVKLTDAACNVRARAASLDSLPTGVVFAPLDLGPSLLLESRHAVIATSHHRAETAMADVIAAFIAPPDRARAIIVRHKANYLALCTDLAEARLYARRHPEGLAAALTARRTPDWLEPVERLSTAEFRVYRVRPDGT
ncbi:MAG: hypothetical protein KJZ64_07750 [Sphingomonadaceae bacterium]|nr:hypothetical protein [Sphingomonadaceae bacterium]